ncbi:MAG TPA: trigger factor, partial [Ruminococcaceae bacterium]|nr:trigger factor [Oscillospiraceae bacterium]
MSLKSSNQVEPNRYQLEVEVDADTFEKAVNQAFHKQSKKISIPGFRKGKAPRAFIEKYYGEQVFYEDAINAVYPAALDQAVKEAGLEFIEDKIDFDVVKAGKDGLDFKATITTKPDISIENYKGLEATKKAVSVTDADVDEEIKKVQDRDARMVTVEDRPAQNGDSVVIDFEGFLNGVPFEGGKAENHTLSLGSGQFIPGFEEQVVGHSTGEEFDVNVTFPEDYHAQELKGKPVVFKVKLHEIKKKELPEVDDDFVKDVSSFDTLAEYREDIRKKLLESREKAANDEMENQLIDKLVDLVKGEIPEAMYQNKINE